MLWRKRNREKGNRKKSINAVRVSQKIIKSGLVLLFCGFLFLPAEEEPEAYEEDLYQSVADEYQYLGLRVYAGKSTTHSLLPQLIPYRFSAPNVFGVAQSVNLGQRLLFEVGGEVGWHEANGIPWYCWDCDVSPFNATTEIAGFYLKYAVYSPSRYKNLWVTASYEELTYEWWTGENCLCFGIDPEVRNGKMKITGVFLGISSESYFIHSKWFLLGGGVSARLPVYKATEFDLQEGTPGTDERRYLPVFDLQLLVEI